MNKLMTRKEAEAYSWLLRETSPKGTIVEMQERAVGGDERFVVFCKFKVRPLPSNDMATSSNLNFCNGEQARRFALSGVFADRAKALSAALESRLNA